MSHDTATRTSVDAQQRLDRLIRMLQLDADNEGLRQTVVDAALAGGRIDLASEQVDAWLARKPDDPAVLFNLANIQIAKRDYRLALATLGNLSERGVREAGVDFNAGLCRYCLGEYVLARPLLEVCYQLGMRSAGLLRLLVSTYHHLGAVDEAVKLANENEGLAVSDAALAGVFALLYLDADDAPRATRWARVALEMNPASIDGRVTQGTLLIARMQTAAARQMLESVITDAPQVARAWIGVGTLDLLDQNLPAAKQNLGRGLELMPGHVGSWHVLAWTQMISGELDAAEQSFNRSMELDRNFAETHGGLASVAAIRGERVKAEHLIEIANRLDPNGLSAKYAQSVLSRQQGNPQLAQQLIDEAVATIAGKDNGPLARLLARAKKPN